MTDAPDAFEVTERHKRGDGSGYHVFRSAPDLFSTVSAGLAQFIHESSAELTEFRKRWMTEHPDGWLHGLEMDYIPVLSEGMVIGYMVISEIDGESYEFAPAKVLEDK